MTALSKNNILPNSYKRLSVQVSLTGLSFLVSHEDTKDTIFFTERKFERNYTPEELLFEIQQVIARETQLSDSFTAVTILYATSMYSVVPAALFDDTKLSEYLKFNAKILVNDYLAYDAIANHDMVVVYVPFVNINNYFFDHYGAFKYYHVCTLLLKTLLDAEKHERKSKAYINIRETQFDLIIVKNGLLEMCNTYTYKTPEDFVYYILFSLEQLKLNPDSLETILTGTVEMNDPIYSICYRYIRNLSFYNNELNRVSLTDGAKPHQHFVLKSSL